jgi:3-phenylpropionate/cinnamic acid dioxygenase small subunit
LTLTASDSLEIMQLVTRVATEPPHTLHLTLNVTIEESVPNPSVNSVMLMITRESPPTVLGSALVRQVVRRTSDGWRIASREIVAA